MEFIQDIYPVKAQYLKNEPVIVRIELCNPYDMQKNVRVLATMMEFTDIVEVKEFEITLNPHESSTIPLFFSAQDTDFKGFGVDLSIYLDNKLEDTASTAFDVVESWRRATRYGFLCGFAPDEEPGDADVKSLLKFHINLVQFYDWAYRHDNYIAPQDDYSDMMGKPASLAVIKRKVKECHGYGMKALAYGAVYAASKEYFDNHMDGGLFTSSEDVYRFIEVFYIMDISKSSKWHNHIIGEYEKAVLKIEFDGIHMDTYGFPKSGISKASGSETEEYLEDLFPALIHDTRERLGRDACLIFNNVCNWPVSHTAKADQDAVYIEVWEPYERYFHIQQIIAWAKVFGEGKPVILAAYLKPFRTEEVEKAENAASILSAVIAANGAYHLFIGEKNSVLTQGYYPNHSKMRPEFVPVMRSYSDFIVRYSHMLFDPELCDVSMTHFCGDNMEYVMENIPASAYGEPGKVWVIIKQSRARKVIHMINLTGNGEDYWNKGKNASQKQFNIRIKAEVLEEPKSIYTVTPDKNMCRPVVIPFTVEKTNRGKVAVIELAELETWSMVVMEFQADKSQQEVY